MIFDGEEPGRDFEELRVVQDAESGLRAIVALHATTRGPAFGGIRRYRYASDADALADALRLAYMMTAKCAMADLPAGGAKTVILDHAGLDAPRAYRKLGEVVEDFRGRYVCGPDVGTGDAELAHVRAVTRHVNPEGNDAGAATAAGVIAGLRGLLRVLEDTEDFARRRFVVQGLGAVGRAVARTLVDAGARVAGADPSPAAQDAARALGVHVIPVADATRTPCDVFVPCALGGVLTEDVASKLPARGVCGSANNQLATPAAGRVLHARGVLYAPDFVVNAGAVVEGVLTVREGATDAVRAKARAHVARTADTVARVLLAAREGDAPPEDVALAEAMRKARVTPRAPA